jgi:flavin-dependent dehydrogenase
MNASSSGRLPSECDVAVLGGGPAGAAAAIALARAGRSVAILERSRYEAPRIGETLAPSARPLLADLGAWEAFLAAGHLPAPGVASAWGGEALFETHFIFNAYGRGWHLDRRRFDAMLAQAARQAGAHLCCGVRVGSCLPVPDGWRIELDAAAGSGCRRRRLHAKLAIDATGRAATLARRQGAKRINVDRLVGLAGLLTCPAADAGGDCEEHGWTLVEARADGWWYSARLPQRRWIAVYMTDADLLPRDRGSRRAFWQARLQQTTHTRARLRAFQLDASPSVVAAGTSRLDRASGDGWVAVGDAAMARDPLSAQGLVHALASGVRAGDALVRHLGGDHAAIAEYAAQADDRFREYSALRGVYYGREQRWPHSAFWRRRHAWQGAQHDEASRTQGLPEDWRGRPVHGEPLGTAGGGLGR